ncbi:MAG: hypothetical protein ACXV8L_12900, partial [Ilumatobacteraceae bacterium]
MLESEALPASGVDPAQFWQGLAALIHDFAPRNAELLAVRGAKSWISAARPSQNCAGSTPLAGRASDSSMLTSSAPTSSSARGTYGDSTLWPCEGSFSGIGGCGQTAAASSDGFTSLQKTSIVCFASASVMSPTG